ncbi:diguanylate cyclase (GGDEF) domain-containing protein [Lachnospiraceae bacterium A10]|nr:diguanylate cyclase (GGDEF) domain-containing protein [Lachnospiraceae bacterium A10]
MTFTSTFLSFIDRYYILLFLDAILLILMTKNKEIRDKHIRRSLYAIIILTFLLSLMHTIDAEIGDLGQLDHVPFLRKIASWFCYSFGPTTFVAFFSMSMHHNRKMLNYILVPLIFNAILYSSIFYQPDVMHPLIYSFGDDNVFKRGNFGYLSHILTIVYIVIFITYVIVHNKGKRSDDFYILISCSSESLLAMLLESLDWSKDLLYTCILASGLAYYLYLYMQVGRLDPLTGLFNRAMYFSDLQTYQKKITALIALDMNGLKNLNDGNGHAAGDTGLKTLASIMERCVPSTANVYRIGGDEFMIICKSLDETQVQQICNKIETEQQRTKYSLSIGYAYRNQNEDLEDLQKIADKHMYEQKTLYYRRSGQDRRRR